MGDALSERADESFDVLNALLHDASATLEQVLTAASRGSTAAMLAACNSQLQRDHVFDVEMYCVTGASEQLIAPLILRVTGLVD